jgi:hypothetical protein
MPPTKKTRRRKRAAASKQAEPRRSFQVDQRLEDALRSFSIIKNQTVAARANGVSPKRLRKAIRELGFAQRKGRGWEITDQLVRTMTVTTKEGRKRLHLVGPATSSLVGRHDNAVKLFLQTNDPRTLDPFVGQLVKDAAGAIHQLETRPNKLFRLGASGEVFEFIYKLTI